MVHGTCSIPTSPNCFFQDTFAFQFRLQQISHTSFQASPPLHRRRRDGEVRRFAAVAAAVEAVLAPEVTTPGAADGQSFTWKNMEKICEIWEKIICLRGKYGLVTENVVYPIVPNGFADHYPVFKWLFHWGYSPFSDIPIWEKWDVQQL